MVWAYREYGDPQYHGRYYVKCDACSVIIETCPKCGKARIWGEKCRHCGE
jgi:translation initiation factor 2 beta subunit (eIF-2beta)/eIF-5